jgi:hypothetical protein
MIIIKRSKRLKIDEHARTLSLTYIHTQTSNKQILVAMLFFTPKELSTYLTYGNFDLYANFMELSPP